MGEAGLREEATLTLAGNTPHGEPVVAVIVIGRVDFSAIVIQVVPVCSGVSSP